MFRLSRLFEDVAAEIASAKRKHPRSAPIPNGTGGAARATWVVIARNACDRAEREGRLTHTHILDEEASEAMDETDPKKLREELIQVMATCARWIEDLDNAV